MSIAARLKKQENVAVGARLARLRALYGWTQAILAASVGWFDADGNGNRSRIAQLETGRVAFSNVDQRELFAKALGLPLLTLNGVLRGEVTPEVAQQIGIRVLVRRASAGSKARLAKMAESLAPTKERP